MNWTIDSDGRLVHRDSSWIKWGVIIAVILIFGLALLQGTATVSGANTREAEKQALGWAKKLGVEPTNVACSSIDSDMNGYYSCTFRFNDDKGSHFKTVECAGYATPGNGCREPRMLLNSNNGF